MKSTKPWYRERWTWLLMAGPALVVVAGIVTTWLAWHSDDGLVSDDYYKEGLAINQSLARDAQALKLGITALVRFGPGHSGVRVSVSGPAAEAGALRLNFRHPTRAGEDQTVELVRVAPGLYEAAMRPLLQGPLLLQLEALDGSWRIGGKWRSGESVSMLRPKQPGEAS